MTALRSIALRTTAAVFVCALMTAGSAFAAPPLITDDAGTVESGEAEIELNVSSKYNKEATAEVTTKYSTLDTGVKIATGLCKNLGVSLAIPYTVNARVKENDRPATTSSGFGDMTLEVKVAFAELAGVSFAIKPTIIIPTGKDNSGLSEGRWQPGTTLIASKEFRDGMYALHANLGYEHHFYRTGEARAANRSGLWSASVAGEARVLKGITVVADFGLATTADRSTTELSAYALAGANCEISNLLALNAGVRLGVTRPEADVGILYGLTLKF